MASTVITFDANDAEIGEIYSRPPWDEVLGVVVGVNEDGSANVITHGELEMSLERWEALTGRAAGLYPGATYYVDGPTGRIHTDPPPQCGGAAQSIGIALSPTVMRVTLGRAEPWPKSRWEGDARLAATTLGWSIERCASIAHAHAPLAGIWSRDGGVLLLSRLDAAAAMVVGDALEDAGLLRELAVPCDNELDNVRKIRAEPSNYEHAVMAWSLLDNLEGRMRAAAATPDGRAMVFAPLITPCASRQVAERLFEERRQSC